MVFTTNHFHQLYNHTAFCFERCQLLVSKDMALSDEAIMRNQKAIMAHPPQVVRTKVIICVCPLLPSFFHHTSFHSMQLRKGIFYLEASRFLLPEQMLNTIVSCFKSVQNRWDTEEGEIALTKSHGRWVAEKWGLVSPDLQAWYPTPQCLTAGYLLSYLSALGLEDFRLKSR